MYAFHPELESDVLKLTGNPTKGFYVDIGAHNGVEGSNTKYFEELGWDGVCIEPHPDVFKQLEQNRKCEKLNCAIWDRDTQVDFLAISGYSEMLSGIIESYDPRHVARINGEVSSRGGSTKVVKVDAKKFESVITREHIDFLSVDTEGSELQILKKIDFSKYDVKVICVENNFANKEFFDFFTERGYKFYKTYLNCDQIFYKE